MFTFSCYTPKSLKKIINLKTDFYTSTVYNDIYLHIDLSSFLHLLSQCCSFWHVGSLNQFEHLLVPVMKQFFWARNVGRRSNEQILKGMATLSSRAGNRGGWTVTIRMVSYLWRCWTGNCECTRSSIEGVGWILECSTIIVFRSWLVGSVCQFVWGLYPEERLNVALRTWQNTLQTWEMNWGPHSETVGRDTTWDPTLRRWRPAEWV